MFGHPLYPYIYTLLPSLDSSQSASLALLASHCILQTPSFTFPPSPSLPYSVLLSVSGRVRASAREVFHHKESDASALCISIQNQQEIIVLPLTLPSWPSLPQDSTRSRILPATEAEKRGATEPGRGRSKMVRGEEKRWWMEGGEGSWEGSQENGKERRKELEGGRKGKLVGECRE